jgi:uncharacterized protein YegP (UPF0339 family)
VRFEILRSTNGRYFWHIKGGNGEVLASSQMYVSKQSAAHAIAVVKVGAPAAPVIDLT